MIRFNTLLRYKQNHEPSLKCHLMLILIGVGHILDGIVLICSLGFVSGGFGIEVARNLAYARFRALDKKNS